MNCYNHNETPALGICKHCNKGICQNCLSDTGGGIACTGNCAEEVVAINKLIDHNKKVIKGASSSWTSSAILYLALGGIFIFSTTFYMKKMDPFLSSVGGVFVLYGIYILLKGRIYTEKR